MLLRVFGKLWEDDAARFTMIIAVTLTVFWVVANVLLWPVAPQVSEVRRLLYPYTGQPLSGQWLEDIPQAEFISQVKSGEIAVPRTVYLRGTKGREPRVAVIQGLKTTNGQVVDQTLQPLDLWGDHFFYRTVSATAVSDTTVLITGEASPLLAGLIDAIISVLWTLCFIVCYGAFWRPALNS